MENIFYAPIFFARNAGKLTHQMAAFAEEYSRQVAPNVNQTYINALYLPSEAYRFIKTVLSREYELLADIPTIAARITQDFPGFAGNITQMATSIYNRLPEYAGDVDNFAAKLAANYPIYAAEVWKIACQGGQWAAEVLTGIKDVIMGTPWSQVPSNALNGAQEYWAWIRSKIDAFDVPWLVPIKYIINDAVIEHKDDHGNSMTTPWQDVGFIPGWSRAIFGGLGGLLPGQVDSRLYCYFVGCVVEEHSVLWLENGDGQELYDRFSGEGETVGSADFPGHAGNLIGRNIADGALVSPPPPVYPPNDVFRYFGSQYFGRTYVRRGYQYTCSYNPYINKSGEKEDGLYTSGIQFSPCDYDIAFPVSEERWQGETREQDGYLGNPCYWVQTTIVSFWDTINTISAADFFGLPKFDWRHQPAGAFPPIAPILPVILLGGMLGGQTSVLCASLMFGQIQQSRRELKRSKHE